MRNLSSSHAAIKADASSEAASLLEAAIPNAAATIPAAAIAAQLEVAIYIADASIPESASTPVNTKVSLSDLLQKVNKE